MGQSAGHDQQPRRHHHLAPDLQCQRRVAALLDRVLGATSLLLDSATGALVEADVFLNTRFQWSVSPQGAAT